MEAIDFTRVDAITFDCYGTVPTKQLGLTTAWVNRRHDRPGFGATPVASATPDLAVPDMKTLGDVAPG
jgi:hypothetical protein